VKDYDVETNTARIPLTGKTKNGEIEEKFGKSPNFTDWSDA
jgi:hypothetical protein